jgi:UDP-GlcNAc:undecaprenyl-phosphate GlcNAc-1-phosphate transferase
MFYFYVYISSALICLFLVPIVIKISNKFGWIINPRSDRWHSKPTALMGGIAIFLTIIFNLFFFLKFKYLFFEISLISFFLLGFYDDLYELKPKIKLILQILITITFILFSNTYFNIFDYKPLNIIITLFWILLITNSCNFLDNMDGILSGILSISTFFISIAFFYSKLYDYSIISLVISAACLAFLFFNKNPAKIFMGDCGSLILGFTISVLIVILQMNNKSQSLLFKISPFLFIIPAILDIFLVIIRRTLSGRKIYLGGKDHITHRLVFMGFNERQTVKIIYIITFLWSFLSILIILQINFLLNYLLFFLLLFTSLIFTFILSKLEVYNESEEIFAYDFLRGNTTSFFNNFKLLILNKKYIIVNIIDLFIYLFILNLLNQHFSLNFNINSILIILVIKIFISNYFKIYKLSWQLISIFDIFLYLRIYILSSIVFYFLSFFNLINFNLDLILYDFFLSINLIFFTRLTYKIILNIISRLRNKRELVLIYGAGKSGYLLCNELILNSKHNFYPILFFDDDILKKNIFINNIQVYNNISKAKEVINKNNIKVIIISSYKISQFQIENLLANLNVDGLIIKRFDFKIS